MVSVMKVLKFGGSSVADASCISQVVSILQKEYDAGTSFAVVFSAFKGITDELIKMSRLAAKGDLAYKEHFEEFSSRHLKVADDLLDGEARATVRAFLMENHEVLYNLLFGIFLVREVSPRTRDYVLSFGERNSAYIIAQVLLYRGIPAAYLDARKVIVTDKEFGNAKVDMELTTQKILAHFSGKKDIQIVTGFIGADQGGLTTTLGRGGSDYSGALLAAALDAEVLEIWTDVDGVLTADPRKVKRALSIDEMSYKEAMEMSHFGAKVIYPPTIQPVLKKQIPILIKNTFHPEHPGTKVSAHPLHQQIGPVKGISSIGSISLLTVEGSGMVGVPGISGRLFSALAENRVNVILITQGSSEHSISLAVDPGKEKVAREAIERAFEYEMSSGLIDPVKVEPNLSVIAIIGERMRFQPGIAGRLFQSLGKNGVNVVAIAQGSSELNISVVVNTADEAKALNALHESFFLSRNNELHLFIVGLGLIGKTLIEQIRKQAAWHLEHNRLDIKIICISNSRKMLFDESGIDLDSWEKRLDSDGVPTNLEGLVERMDNLNLSNTIFVDNTASKEVAALYGSVLNASISISTPNKIATSSSFETYRRLKQLAQQKGVQFLFETNVGAGLPLISTLNDLIESGDHILKIEGVFSGSLSYIFNNFSPEKTFASVVREAREKGFTEPDPREDLLGQDVRRKLVILGREIGWPLETDDVAVGAFLPQACLDADGVADFFDELTKHESYFHDAVTQAVQNGQRLRMIGVLENGQAKLELTAVHQDSPFYYLDGSDNMVIITTSRYQERPLIIRGPGAGAEVTAAGVFAEIIKIGRYLS
jgi:aspartokinase/homoserine dehydrogenase 1